MTVRSACTDLEQQGCCSRAYLDDVRGCTSVALGMDAGSDRIYSESVQTGLVGDATEYKLKSPRWFYDCALVKAHKKNNKSKGESIMIKASLRRVSTPLISFVSVVFISRLR